MRCETQNYGNKNNAFITWYFGRCWYLHAIFICSSDWIVASSGGGPGSSIIGAGNSWK
jgi:hypothetical protein